MLRTILWNVLVLFVCLIFLELTFGTWLSGGHALYKLNLPRDFKYIMKNPIGSYPQYITYSRDRFGFRGLDGDVSEIDIITVGGSTTNQATVDDNETFQAIMKDLANQEGKVISIANAGINGQSTFGHIENFTSWFNNIDDLKSRYILFYIGINDALKFSAIGIGDNLSAGSGARIRNYVKSRSIIYQVYKLVTESLQEARADYEFNRDNIAHGDDLITDGLVKEPMTPELTKSLLGLRQRISILAELTREFGAEPIFVNQRSARWTRVDGEIRGVPEYRPDAFERVRKSLSSEYDHLNGVDFYNFERAISDTVMSECRKTSSICIDLFGEIDFNVGEDFHDSVHTTPSGSRKIGEYLYKTLKGKGVL